MHKSRREFFKKSAALLGTALFAQLSARAWARGPLKHTGPPEIKLSCAAYSFRKYLTAKDPKQRMTLEDFIDLCAEWKLDGTELTSYYFPKPVTDEYLAKLKKKANDLGLQISGTAIGNNFFLPPGAKRDEQIALCKQWTDYCAKMGGRTVRIFAGGGIPKGATEDEAVRWAVECIEECCKVAAEKKIYLCLENHGSYTSQVDNLLRIVREVKSEWCAVNLDTGNFRDYDGYLSIRKAAPYAAVVQVKTHVRVAGRSEPADYKRIIDILRAANFQGYVSLEYEDKEDPKTAVPRHIKALKQAISG